MIGNWHRASDTQMCYYFIIGVEFGGRIEFRGGRVRRVKSLIQDLKTQIYVLILLVAALERLKCLQ